MSICSARCAPSSRPASAIGDMAKDGAGFAGFASWLDMTPADPDVLAIPDPASLIQLPWKREVGWLAADPYMNGKPVEQAPRNILKRMIAKAAKAGFTAQDRRRMRVLSPDAPTGRRSATPPTPQAKPCYDQSALMRRYDVISEICDAMLELGWGAYQNDHEDANGQFEMNWAVRRRARHRRSHGLLQIHGQGHRREAWLARHLHAEAVRQSHRQRLPRPCLAVAGRQERVRRRQGRARPVAHRLQFHRRGDERGRRHLLDHQSHGQFLQAHQRAGDDVGRHLVA